MLMSLMEFMPYFAKKPKGCRNAHNSVSASMARISPSWSSTAPEASFSFTLSKKTQALVKGWASSAANSARGLSSSKK